MKHQGPSRTLQAWASGWGFYLLIFVRLWHLELTIKDGPMFSVIVPYITKRKFS